MLFYVTCKQNCVLLVQDFGYLIHIYCGSSNLFCNKVLQIVFVLLSWCILIALFFFLWGWNRINCFQGQKLNEKYLHLPSASYSWCIMLGEGINISNWNKSLIVIFVPTRACIEICPLSYYIYKGLRGLRDYPSIAKIILISHFLLKRSEKLHFRPITMDVKSASICLFLVLLLVQSPSSAGFSIRLSHFCM